MTATPSRATVVKGAAWAIPTIAVAGAVPAFAASRPCPSVPSGSQWTTTYSGTLGSTSSGSYAWNAAGTQWSVYRDNGSSANTLTFTTSTTISGLIVNQTYTMQLSIRWGYGNGVANQSNGGSARVNIGGMTRLNRATRTSGDGGLGTSPGVSNYSITFTANATSMPLQYQVVLNPRTLQASDDFVFTAPTFSNCI